MRFVVREFVNQTYSNHVQKIIGIGIKDRNGLVFPSPISNFIKSEYANKGKALNTQRNASYAITRFLNYCYSNIAKDLYKGLEYNGLQGLCLDHGAAYITSLSLENRSGLKESNYIKREIDYINRFYYWLKKQNIPIEQYKLKERDVKHSKYQKTPIKVKENVFELNDIEVVYPINNSIKISKIKTFGDNRDDLIPAFINIARRVAPEIALGIALQIFGGLRRSEVVNLKKSSFRWRNKMLILEIRDNQTELFFDSKNHSDVQVKCQRDQICLCPDLIKELHDEHLKYLSKIQSKKTEAMFISERTQYPLNGKMFADRFNKVKNSFLEEILLNGNIQDYLLLSSNQWSTHIGRGIFTNILLGLGLLSSQIAKLRGDNSIYSALAYVDEHTMIRNVKVAIENYRILL